MTEEYNREHAAGTAQASGLFEDFKSMPLEDKISSLFRMEIETLNELLRSGADCALGALREVGDAISSFGTKLEHEAKAAAEANSSDSADVPSYTVNAPHESDPPSYPTDAGYTPPNRSDSPFE